MIQLTPDNNNSLSINGTVDIKINRKTVWNNVDLSIIMSKGSTITIDPNDKQTDNHFGDQQVYGIVNRLIVMYTPLLTKSEILTHYHRHQI